MDLVWTTEHLVPALIVSALITAVSTLAAAIPFLSPLAPLFSFLAPLLAPAFPSAPTVTTTIPTTTAALVIIEIRPIPLSRIILIHAAIMLIIHLLRTPLSTLFRLVAVPGVLAFGLGQLVDFAADEAGEQLFGEGVVHGLAFLALVVFEELHAFEGGGAGDEFMRELGLVLSGDIVVVDLLVGVASLVCVGLAWAFWKGYVLSRGDVPQPNILAEFLVFGRLEW
jgi:hypothetical protein